MGLDLLVQRGIVKSSMLCMLPGGWKIEPEIAEDPWGSLPFPCEGSADVEALNIVGVVRVVV